MGKHLSAVTWTIYYVYEWTLWPIGTFLLGVYSQSILWSAIGAIPVLLVSYRSDRIRQKESENPASKMNSIILLFGIELVKMFGLYYFGVYMGSG